MASRPQQLPEAAQRRHTQRESEQGTQIPPQASRPRSPSQASDDSQTVVLSHSDARIKPEVSVTSQEGENLHCWICLMDEPLSDFDAGNWKEPCSCNLTAHEECLFQWIASQEDDRKIECPQCKTRINISQPNDYFLKFVSMTRRLADSCVLPAGVAAVLGIGYTGLLVYGQNTVTLIFGSEEASRLFSSAISGARTTKIIRGDSLWDTIRRFLVESEDIFLSISKRTLAIACPFFPSFQGRISWRYLASLPFIAPLLVLSRLHVADDLFTFLPVAYSVFQVLNKHPQEIMEWPPSPGLTLATLPLFRIGYSEAHKYFFQDLEKKWNQAVQRQPREGETAEDVARAAEAREERHELEVGIELGPIEDDGTDEEDADIPDVLDQQQGNAQQQADLLNMIRERVNLVNAEEAAELAEELGMNNPQDNVQPQQNAPPDAVEQHVNAIEGRLNLVTDGLATTVMGALFFPAISWAMGSLIKISLPKTWVKEPHVLRSWRSAEKLSWSKGFLQTQFGRSIAGGCLFIVLKDAAVLYYKWKRAKDMRKRRIMNYRERNDARVAE